MIESLLKETPETVASHYNDLDIFYREVWGLHVHHGFWKTGHEGSDEATVALLDQVFRDIEISEGMNICDIGCGYGESARYLAHRYKSKVTGLSVSSKQLAHAQSLGLNPLVNLIECDWMENNLPANSFQLAYSIESSEHMPDLRKFFTEAYRVLTPGGSFKVCAWLSTINPSELEHDYLLKPICTEGRMHLSDSNEYENLIYDSGFKNVRYEDITDNVKRTWTLCLSRYFKKLLTDPKYLRFLMKDPSQNKKFLWSLLRIRLAYETKSLRYGIFSAVK